MEDYFSKELSDYKALKQSIHNKNASTEEHSTPSEIKWAVAEADGWTPHYNPNDDKVVWTPHEPTPMEQVPNINKAGGSMSPEQMANIYTTFQWKNTSGVNDVLLSMVKDFHDGELTEQRLEELGHQFAKETFELAKKATGFKVSQLKPQDKVSTKEARQALIEAKGADYATESDYLKKLKEGA